MTEFILWMAFWTFVCMACGLAFIPAVIVSLAAYLLVKLVEP